MEDQQVSEEPLLIVQADLVHKQVRGEACVEMEGEARGGH